MALQIPPPAALLALIIATAATGCAAANDEPVHAIVASRDSTAQAGLCVEGVDPANREGRAALLALQPSCVRLTLRNPAPYYVHPGTGKDDPPNDEPPFDPAIHAFQPVLDSYAAEIQELGGAGISVYLLLNVEILGLEPSGGTLDMRHLRPVPFRAPNLAAVHPNAPDQFVAFAAAAVKRLAPAGIRRVELVNEPNNKGFLDPASYGYLLGQAYPAIKAVAPAVRVTSGAILTTNDNPNLDYLAAVYAIGVNGKDARVPDQESSPDWDKTRATWETAGGTPWDDVGIHLYEANVSFQGTAAGLGGFAHDLSAKVDSFYEVVTQGEQLSANLNHRSNVDPHFYVSEIGWKLEPICIGPGHETVPCAPDSPEVAQEELQQAARVTAVLGALRQNSHVRMLSYFDFADTRDSGAFGLFRTAPYTKANARPSFSAFCALLGKTETSCLVP